MKKIPITFIVDDSMPFIMTPYVNREPKITADGRPLIRFSPLQAVYAFAEVIERQKMKGKFSVIPMGGNEGDIINGFRDVDQKKVEEWLDCARTRIYPSFSICPEMLSHYKAVDLATGKARPEREDIWASTQDRTTLTPYITRALELLKQAGFDCHGVTSPWYFGKEIEEEYIAALSQAMQNTYGHDSVYYFLHQLRGVPGVKPWISYEEDDCCVVAIPAVTRDWFWESMDTTRCDDEFISHLADYYLTADGKSGCIIKEMDELGSYPILCTHWQSLLSNGTMAGLRAFEEVGRRINEHLLDRVEWFSFDELLAHIVANKDSYREKPISMEKVD
jgi:hypothetical protein